MLLSSMKANGNYKSQTHKRVWAVKGAVPKFLQCTQNSITFVWCFAVMTCRRKLRFRLCQNDLLVKII